MIAKIIKQHSFWAVLVMVLILLFGLLRIIHYIKSPDVIFLSNRSGAEWIKYDSEFQLDIKPSSRPRCAFKYVFKAGSDIENPSLTLQALKKFQLLFDDKIVFSSDSEFDQWKQVYHVSLPSPVKAGDHEIIIMAESEYSYPAIIAYSNTLPVKTGPGWLASFDGKNWSMAVPASHTKMPSVLKNFPSSVDALARVAPYLAVVFVIVFFISFFSAWFDEKLRKMVAWRPQPSHVRWVLLFLWSVLSINNMFNLNFQVGVDGWGHMDYLDYIVTKGSLPLAPEGWQMFQPPLTYILSAPVYAILSRWFDLPAVVKMMVIFPFVYGAAQIEIVYRTARLVFKERKDLQIIAIIAGTLLPIHIYSFQYFGNEPLAALLSSLLILLSLKLVMPGAKDEKSFYFIFMGFLWGLALITKVTALLIAPVLVLVIIYHMKLTRKPVQNSVPPLALIFSISILTAGWYYLRNYLVLGNPFLGVFGHSQMLQWWQDPGYRTWAQLLSFGRSLIHPVYAGVASFWDMLYSTLWLDGINSGFIDVIPWNKYFMVAGAILALVPSLFMATAVVSWWSNKGAVYRNAVALSAGAMILFVAVMMDMFMVFPIHSRTKASYTLGLLPCYVVLIAAGAEPFLKNRFVRSVSIALFACWAFAAYAAFFVIMPGT